VTALTREARQRGPVLVLHAGDFVAPSLLSTRLKYKGAQMIEAMNAVGLDAVTFGNHEFDFGCSVLADRIRQSTFPWVAANVRLPPEMKLPGGKILPYRVLTIADLRIGIFGLTVPKENPVRCNTEDITFLDPVSTASAIINELRREGVQLIIALTHLSIAQDRALASSQPDIDLIVGGHDHDAMTDLVGKTLITKAGTNATSLGIIRIKAIRTDGGLVVEKSWTQSDVNPNVVQPDAAVSRALAPYATEMSALSRTVGATEVPLDVREEVVREGESNFGNYIADFIRAETRTDVAIVNGGALQGDRLVPAGALTMKDLISVLLFQDRMVAIKLTGAQLLEALENGVSRAGERDGRFPQVSGLSFAFDPTRPAGKRILQIRIGNAPLEPHRTYTMGTITFLTTPGNMDGYMLPRQSLEMRGDLTDAVLRDLAKGPIKPDVDGRIVTLHQPRP
jgi:5'-nucleotidase / UDP-sugar diphosphatase